MIRHELPDSVVYNLLDSQVFLALSQRLSRLLRKWFVALLAFTSGFEVDFILNGMTAIEGKGKEVVGERDLRDSVPCGRKGCSGIIWWFPVSSTPG